MDFFEILLNLHIFTLQYPCSIVEQMSADDEERDNFLIL